MKAAGAKSSFLNYLDITLVQFYVLQIFLDMALVQVYVLQIFLDMALVDIP